MTNPTFLASAAHVFGAYAVVMTAGHLGGLVWGAGGLACVLVYAVIKEFWYDPTYEIPQQTTADDWLDFGCLAGAALIAFMVLALTSAV